MNNLSREIGPSRSADGSCCEAANKFVGIEKLDEEELRQMSQALAEKAECVEDKADEKAENTI